MARQWVPPANIEPNEHIGRRLFDEPLLIGSASQPSYEGLLVTHFEETRGVDYSVDRLGRSSIDRRVVAYLRPRAEAAGKTFRKPKTFNGWAVLPARELTKVRKRPGLTLQASPVSDPEPLDNRYHAHVVRPADLDATLMALYLRHLFITHGSVEAVESAKSKPQKPSWWRSLIQTVVSLFKRPA
jgi:hypothetical protein